MKWKIAAIGIIFTILSGVALEHRAQAQPVVSMDLFYEKLSPYGEWAPHDKFGYIWQPYDVGPQWKPYADGRWEWSDQGWIWISYEPWGWATYHYGRWVYDDYRGWIWIPGTTWAPAWVSWHESPEYIGWSPLPPDRRFFVEIGFIFNSYKPYYKPYHRKHHKHHYKKKHNYYHDYYDDPHNYHPPARHCVFLPYGKFGHHKHAGKAAIPPEYAITLRNTKNVTKIKHVNNKVINYGPDKYLIEKRSNRKLVKHKIVDKERAQFRGRQNINHLKGESYNVYRPKIKRVRKDTFTTNRGSNIKNGSRNTHLYKPNKFNKDTQGSNPKSFDTQTRKPTFSRTTKEHKGDSKKKYNSHKSGHEKYSYKNRKQKKYKPEHAINTRGLQGNRAHKKDAIRGKTIGTIHKNTRKHTSYSKNKYGQKNKSYNVPNYKPAKKVKFSKR